MRRTRRSTDLSHQCQSLPCQTLCRVRILTDIYIWPSEPSRADSYANPVEHCRRCCSRRRRLRYVYFRIHHQCSSETSSATTRYMTHHHSIYIHISDIFRNIINAYHQKDRVTLHGSPIDANLPVRLNAHDTLGIVLSLSNGSSESPRTKGTPCNTHGGKRIN